MKKIYLTLLLCLVPVLGATASDTTSQPVIQDLKKTVETPQEDNEQTIPNAVAGQVDPTPPRVFMRLPSVNDRIKMREEQKRQNISSDEQ